MAFPWTGPVVVRQGYLTETGPSENTDSTSKEGLREPTGAGVRKKRLRPRGPLCRSEMARFVPTTVPSSLFSPKDPSLSSRPTHFTQSTTPGVTSRGGGLSTTVGDDTGSVGSSCTRRSARSPGVSEKVRDGSPTAHTTTSHRRQWWGPFPEQRSNTDLIR